MLENEIHLDVAEYPTDRLVRRSYILNILQIEVNCLRGQVIYKGIVAHKLFFFWEQLLAEPFAEELIEHILENVLLSLKIFLSPYVANVRRFAGSIQSVYLALAALLLELGRIMAHNPQKYVRLTLFA